MNDSWTLKNRIRLGMGLKSCSSTFFTLMWIKKWQQLLQTIATGAMMSTLAEMNQDYGGMHGTKTFFRIASVISLTSSKLYPVWWTQGIDFIGCWSFHRLLPKWHSMKDKRSAKTSRLFKKLSDQNINKKIPRSSRYQLTKSGRQITGGLIHIREHMYPEAVAKVMTS